jgi:uncharacterized protein YndB with AHSA1/START domain
MAATRLVSASRTIAAPPEAIFAYLSDAAKHPLIDGSGTVKEPSAESVPLSLGATFSMKMNLGVPYTTKNKVVAFEPDREIAWHHFAGFIWKYELTPVDGGTEVTESFDYSNALGFFLTVTKIPETNRRNMIATLARIAELVETPPAS